MIRPFVKLDSVEIEVSINRGTPSTSVAGLSYYGALNSSSYYTSNVNANATTAISICSAAGGNLVSINDSIENAYVSNILPGHFWIGYTDELVEGSFVWIDGSTSSYTNWANNEPNNSGPTNNEDYTLMNAFGTGDGYWNDGDNTSSFPYVCEFNHNYNISLVPNQRNHFIHYRFSSHYYHFFTVDITIGNTTCQDSVTVTVNPVQEVSIDSTSCDSIQWGGDWLASTGTYVNTLQNAACCDSIVTLNLTINNVASSDTTATACDSFDWYGNTYTSTGSHTETLQSDQRL